MMPSQTYDRTSDLSRLRREEKRQRREAREQLFFDQLPHQIAQLSEEGIKVRVLNQGYQIQLSRGERLANFYPRSGSFHFQKPGLGATSHLSFAKAIEVFRQTASH